MRLQRSGAILGMLLVWLAFFFPAMAGKVRFPVDLAGPASAAAPQSPLANEESGDAYYAMYPWHHHLGQRLGNGEMPLWDPHRFGGSPFAADIGVGAWYPPNWLYALGNFLLTFTLIGMASSLAALLVTYWFLRVLELHPYAAALGAVVFAFSAFAVKWATNETVVASTIWMALPLGGLEVARRGSRWRGIGLAALGLALVVVGGHAQVALYVWLAAFLWVVVAVAATALASWRGQRSAPPRGEPVRNTSLVQQLVRAAAPAAVAVVLAVGLGAVQLLPARELSAEIVRQRTTFEVARSGFLAHRQLSTLLVPDYLGTPVDRNYAGPGVNYTETALYAGLLTVPLAAGGLLHRRRRVVAFFVLLGSIGILGATGTPGVLYRLLLSLPGFSRTLSAGRLLVLFDFAMGCLAALGLDRLIRGGAADRRLLRILGGAYVAVAGVVLWLTIGQQGTPLPDAYVFARGIRAVAVLALGGVVFAAFTRVPAAWTARLALVVVGLASVDLWMSGYRFNAFHEPREVYPATQTVRAIRDAPGPRSRYAELGTFHLPPNDALVHGQYGLGGYDPLIPRRTVELLSVAEDQTDRARTNFLGPFAPETARSAVFDLLGVDRLIAPTSLDLGSGVSTVLPGPPAVLARPGAFPPAFLVRCWELVPESEVLTRLSSMSSEQLRSTAVLADDAASRRRLPTALAAGCDGLGGATPGPAGKIDRYEAERVSIRTHDEEPGLLILTDSWFPGWQATVDGKGVPVLRVDHALRGVVLPAGEHRVEFRYRPASFRAGAVVSAATLVTLAAAGLWSVRKKRAARPLRAA